jgi:hypothetical protein
MMAVEANISGAFTAFDSELQPIEKCRRPNTVPRFRAQIRRSTFRHRASHDHLRDAIE